MGSSACILFLFLQDFSDAMTKRTGVISLLILLGAISLSAQTENASTGLAFLKLGVGGRAIGMGEAYMLPACTTTRQEFHSAQAMK